MSDDDTYQPTTVNSSPAFIRYTLADGDEMSQHKQPLRNALEAEKRAEAYGNRFKRPRLDDSDTTPIKREDRDRSLSPSRSPFRLRPPRCVAEGQRHTSALYDYGGALNSQTGEHTYVDHLLGSSDEEDADVKTEGKGKKDSLLDELSLEVETLQVQVTQLNKRVHELTAERDELEVAWSEAIAELKDWRSSARAAWRLFGLARPYTEAAELAHS
ncbi:hypothetical protein FB45DRAFT_1011667 [Roridomyces roridus]|uniref:Uncharacterized protein n=1 Tax=Roridomyces roridus TaxID=1738132 RepID=A0AAD7FAA3_9AGAR|nr:hypothetical protein FB45DRAFT_1011667 [Roridomyces roridus]